MLPSLPQLFSQAGLFNCLGVVMQMNLLELTRATA